MTSVRDLLYLPLGVIPSLFFFARLTLQWYQAEKKNESYAGSSFWKLSLLGNLTLMLHYFVQVQYPFAVCQSLNAVIAWRNLNFLNASKPYSKKTVIAAAFLVFLGVTLLFAIQSYFFIGEMDWVRTPTKPWDSVREYHSLGWHIFGTVGGLIFAGRFWVQWWFAESKGRSGLDKNFWYLSIIGTVMVIIYSVRLNDIVMLYYNCFSLIPYFRNLVLIRRRDRLG